MPAVTLEERVSALETELERLKREIENERPARPVPWWESIYGAFAGSEEYEQAMRLGRVYRESLRPRDDVPGA